MYLHFMEPSRGTQQACCIFFFPFSVYQLHAGFRFRSRCINAAEQVSIVCIVDPVDVLQASPSVHVLFLFLSLSVDEKLQ